MDAIRELIFALEDTERCNFRGQFGRGSRFVGECRAEIAPDMVVRSQRCQVGPITLSFLHTTVVTRIQRTQRHIWEDCADFLVLWFVRSGRLVLNDGSVKKCVGPNEFSFTRSRTPLLAECHPDAEEPHQALHVILDADPPGIFTAEPDMRGIWSTGHGHLAIAASLLADVFEHDGALQPESSAQLVESAMQLILQGLAGPQAISQLPESPGERRLREIMRFIDLQLTNPHLTRAVVAERCRISERYLATLLEQEGTSFSGLVWQGRLRRAHEWISVSDGAEITIAEISYALGFKSPAHFTRKFQRAYGVTPRTLRDHCRAKKSPDQTPSAAK